MNEMNDEFVHFSLQNEHASLLPPGSEIILNVVSGLVLFLDWEQREIRYAALLDPEERALVCVLLDSWPAITSFRELYGCLDPTSGDLDDSEEQGTHAEDRLAMLHERLRWLGERLGHLGVRAAQGRQGYTLCAAQQEGAKR